MTELNLNELVAEFHAHPVIRRARSTESLHRDIDQHADAALELLHSSACHHRRSLGQMARHLLGPIR